jgi:hypothetical protein
MRITSFSLWLGCIASSAVAFSTLSKPSTFSRVAAGEASTSGINQFLHNERLSTKLNVASADISSIAAMERGVGGRIEAAFEASKEKGEAAFISFITAGYPTAQGAYFEFFAIACDEVSGVIHTTSSQTFN